MTLRTIFEKDLTEIQGWLKEQKVIESIRVFQNLFFSTQDELNQAKEILIDSNNYRFVYEDKISDPEEDHPFWLEVSFYEIEPNIDAILIHLENTMALITDQKPILNNFYIMTQNGVMFR